MCSAPLRLLAPLTADIAEDLAKAGVKPPAGYMPIPGSKHGGYVSGTGPSANYWYPDSKGARGGLKDAKNAAAGTHAALRVVADAHRDRMMAGPVSDKESAAHRERMDVLWGKHHEAEHAVKGHQEEVKTHRERAAAGKVAGKVAGKDKATATPATRKPKAKAPEAPTHTIIDHPVHGKMIVANKDVEHHSKPPPEPSHVVINHPEHGRMIMSRGDFDKMASGGKQKPAKRPLLHAIHHIINKLQRHAQSLVDGVGDAHNRAQDRAGKALDKVANRVSGGVQKKKQAVVDIHQRAEDKAHAVLDNIGKRLDGKPTGKDTTMRGKLKKSGPAMVVLSMLVKSAMAHSGGDKPPAGYEAIPGGVKGGYRSKNGTGYHYWYPTHQARREAFAHHQGLAEDHFRQARAAQPTDLKAAKRLAKLGVYHTEVATHAAKRIGGDLHRDTMVAEDVDTAQQASGAGSLKEALSGKVVEHAINHGADPFFVGATVAINGGDVSFGGSLHPMDAKQYRDGFEATKREPSVNAMERHCTELALWNADRENRAADAAPDLSTEQMEQIRAWHHPETSPGDWDEADSRLRTDGINPRDYGADGGERLAKRADSTRPPPGYMPIPGSKHGGYIKGRGDQASYWYPSAGQRHSAHLEANDAYSAANDKHRDAYNDVRTTARAHGVGSKEHRAAAKRQEMAAHDANEKWQVVEGHQQAAERHNLIHHGHEFGGPEGAVLSKKSSPLPGYRPAPGSKHGGYIGGDVTHPSYWYPSAAHQKAAYEEAKTAYHAALDVDGAAFDASRAAAYDHGRGSRPHEAAMAERRRTLKLAQQAWQPMSWHELVGGSRSLLVKSAATPPRGFVAIPHGVNGGYRRAKGGGQYDYWYPTHTDREAAIDYHKTRAEAHEVDARHAFRERNMSEARAQYALQDQHTQAAEGAGNEGPVDERPMVAHDIEAARHASGSGALKDTLSRDAVRHAVEKGANAYFTGATAAAHGAHQSIGDDLGEKDRKAFHEGHSAANKESDGTVNAHAQHHTELALWHAIAATHRK